jgi:flagellar hook-associated protein 3 FlgL
MISNLDPASQQFLDALSQLQSSLLRVQRQISSGVRIQRPSDSPGRIADIVIRESDVARAVQIRQSMGRLQADTDTAEVSLQQSVKILEQALVIGQTALSSASDQVGRADILAGQLEGLHEQLVRLSLTTVEGRFVFGGDNDGQAPYQLNVAQPNGVDQLTNGSATRLVLDADGSRFSARRSAQEIFDHRNPDNSLASDNAFAALQSLQAAVQSGDITQTAAALDDVKAAHVYLNQQLAFYGSVQNRVSRAIEQSHQLETRVQAELSGIRDTDLAAAATELLRIQTSMQASLQARSNFTTPTLFDLMG